MSKKVLETMPKLPGVYIFKDNDEGVLYIGKAKNLYKRVSSYFVKQNMDWKVHELVKEHSTIDHILTKNELEALLLEAHLVKQFKPKYNVLLKDGNPFIYLCVTEGKLPKLELLRIKKQKGTYFGPFIYKQKARQVYDYLVRTFKLKLCSQTIKNGCLNYHLNKCAGNCLPNFNLNDYKNRLSLVIELLKGNFKQFKALIEKQINEHNTQFNFEKSRNLNEYLINFESISAMLKTGFTKTKYIKDIAHITTPFKHKSTRLSTALKELQELLNLKEEPITIDCFDISHFQSSHIVGSCIRFKYGLPDKHNFRRFKIKSLDQQNDYAALQEIVSRRYKKQENLPDIILIDGGKGQLSTIEKLNLPVLCISLAKREETIFSSTIKDGIKLDLQTNLGQLLIALRDYAHHFAVSYHKILRHKNLVS